MAGSRGVTLRDVAEAAQVTAATASRALDPTKEWLVNELTRERVRRAARDLGYRGNAMARGLRKGRSGTIGIAVADLGNPFIAPVLRGIENAVEAHDLMPVIAETQDRHDRLAHVLEHFVSRRVDVAVVTAARHGDARLLAKTATAMPIVLAVRTVPGSAHPAVAHDDHEAGVLAARCLIDLGHRRIAQLRGPDDVSSFVARTEAFGATLASARLKEAVSPRPAASPSLEEGRRLMAEILARPGPPVTAVFAHNDLMALGAIDAIRASGLSCPDDISVIGCNDSPLTDHVTPALTTVRLPGYQLGRLAAELALGVITDPAADPIRLSVPPTLVTRQSTAPPTRARAARHPGPRPRQSRTA